MPSDVVGGWLNPGACPCLGTFVLLCANSGRLYHERL
jgi:hypothetical protein